MERTKLNPFCLVQNKLRKVGKLNITDQGKQNSQVTYLGCILDETISGEPMAYKTIKKINSRLIYLFRKKHFLKASLKHLLCNAFIQPHFDHALCGILIFAKNWKIKFKWLRINVFNFAPILIRWLIYHRMSSKN